MDTTQPSTSFEIRIAVLGYVSAGKTTVINALLRDTYGQVGMRRTTAGVNQFRLHFRVERDDITTTTRDDDDTKEGAAATEDVNWVDVGDEFHHHCCCVPAAETHQEIAKDNIELRDSTSVNVKSFDIAVNEPLFHQVRSDTRIVLVDIPGINEAGAGGKYWTYVQEHWHTFDGVWVVMDGRQGTNTEEQVKLLEFVHKNNMVRRNARTMIVCNKVDDTDDLEQAELVKEAKDEVRRIFGTAGPTYQPTFVTTSAEFAYVYRTAANMSFLQFQQQLDDNLINKIGRREVGWTFATFPLDEKLQVAYQAGTDQSLYTGRMRATNFDSLLNELKEMVGGPDTQLQLLVEQMDVTLRNLSHATDFVQRLDQVFDKREFLGLPTDDLSLYFWATYEKSEKAALDAFAKCPGDVSRLAKPMNDLLDYKELCRRRNLNDEAAKCLPRLKLLASRQIEILLNEEAKAVPPCWTCRKSVTKVRWRTLNPTDWLRMCQSLCLLAHDRTFREEFGPEIMSLEVAKHKWLTKAVDEASAFGECPHCSADALDFNGFCRSCHYVTFVATCPILKKLAEDPVCHTCRGVATSNYGDMLDNTCGSCRKPKKSSPKPAGFVAYKAVGSNPPSIELVCPRKGCSTVLSRNRICATCRTVYCLKGSARWRSPSCLFCGGVLNVGRCTSPSCVGKQLAWGVLPYASILDLMRCERDQAYGSMKPKFPESYQSLVHVEVPTTHSDPNHFGYVAMTYCHIVESLVGAKG